jgi:transposase InsO family protein
MEQVRQLVCEERKQLPCLGVRKLYFKLQPAFRSLGLKLGRDKLFAWVGDFGLLIKPRRRYVQTTMSKHHLRKYPNLVKELPVTLPEQVWVSDITYLKTLGGTCYLNLVTDAFSRKIVGYAVAGNMEAVSMSPALAMALKEKQTDTPTIHHSDRGLQYCSGHYVSLATGNGMKMSMTQNADPYENALAERMNRTLKEEFGLGKTLANLQQAKELVKQAVELYNNHRPHLSLQMNTPNAVHQQQVMKNKVPACLTQTGTF